MRTRSNKSYDITETETRGTKSTSQNQRRAVQNFKEDPDYEPFRQLRSTKNRPRDTSSSTTFKPIIIRVKKAYKRRTSRRPRWDYGKLVAAQAEAHRAAFQEAGVNHAPPPTWSYVRALAEKAAAQAAHRAAFQKAGVDHAPPPTWSYKRIAAAKKTSKAAHRAAFEDSGVDCTPIPTWSYKRAAARKARRSDLQRAGVSEVPALTWSNQSYESLRATCKSVSDTSASSGWSALPATGVDDAPALTRSNQRYESFRATQKSSREPSESSDYGSL